MAKKHFFEPGKRYGKLTLLEEFRDGKYVKWRCKCDCGKECASIIQAIVTGATKSCGCLRVEFGESKATHGHCRKMKSGGRSREHMSHNCMMTRCYNPNCREYPRYGGRGIKVAERWHNFVNFLADMGQKPRREYSLDRIDNNKDYGPDNCRWATDIEQCNNRRTSRILDHQGCRLTVSQWARAMRMKAPTLTNRLKLGWSIADALTTPLFFQKKETV